MAAGLITLGVAQTLGTYVLMPGFDPALTFELIEAFRGVCVGGVTTMLAALLGHPSSTKRDLSSVRYALSGGAIGHSRRAIRADLLRSMHEQILAKGIAAEQELDEVDRAVRKHLASSDTLVLPNLLFLAWGRTQANPR